MVRRGYQGAVFLLILVTDFFFAAPRVALGKQSDFSEKYAVCSITINSGDEIATLKKHLPAKDFSFVELTNGTNVQDWFEQACAAGVQCDILVISGHFGGTFFGSSGLSLSLDELEHASCSRKCDNILKKPREVFLFGCNTLAGKDKDDRTPEQYLNVLLADGIPRTTAERVVESRYGASGASNKERMQLVFQGVPHLYGFSSIGPSGKNVKGFLEKYFATKGSYADYLTRESVRESVDTLTYLNNGDLAKALKLTSFTQCSGLKDTDPNFNLKQNICRIRDESQSIKSRLELLKTLMTGNSMVSYLPAIEAFLSRHPVQFFNAEEKQVFDSLSGDSAAKNIVLEVVKQLRTPVLRMDYATFAHNLGWLENSEFTRLKREIAVQLLKPPITTEVRDILCNKKWEFDVDMKGLDAAIFRDEKGLYALGCMKPSDPGIHLALIESMQVGDRDISLQARDVLARLPLKDSKVLQALVVLLNSKSDWIRKWAAAELLKKSRPSDPQIQLQLVALLKSERDTSSSAASVLREIGPFAPEVQHALLDVLRESEVEAGVADINVILYRNKTLDDKSISTLVSMIESPSASRRLTVMHILGNFSPNTGDAPRALVAAALKEPEPWLRANALEALEKISPVDADIQMKMLQSLNDESEMVRAYASQAVRNLVPANQEIRDLIEKKIQSGEL